MSGCRGAEARTRAASCTVPAGELAGASEETPRPERDQPGNACRKAVSAAERLTGQPVRPGGWTPCSMAAETSSQYGGDWAVLSAMPIWARVAADTPLRVGGGTSWLKKSRSEATAVPQARLAATTTAPRTASHR